MDLPTLIAPPPAAATAAAPKAKKPAKAEERSPAVQKGLKAATKARCPADLLHALMADPTSALVHAQKPAPVPVRAAVEEDEDDDEDGFDSQDLDDFVKEDGVQSEGDEEEEEEEAVVQQEKPKKAKVCGALSIHASTSIAEKAVLISSSNAVLVFERRPLFHVIEGACR